ncbi:MAG: hypothetical protein GY913_08390 [Proteobacteria bacterium]|nr:hypothetical protein [Pseudomonadota bacterium]MCP4916928.1 hypothetical protein [Pseudomonadota bacterium]
MPTIRTRHAFGPRDLSRFPSDDDALGRSLLSIVEGAAVDGKLPRPSILGFRADGVERYDIPPIVEQGGNVHAFAAAVAGQPGMETVCIAGTVGIRRGRGEPVPALAVFLEWEDGRWWSALRMLKERQLVDELGPVIRQAEDGDPKPRGIGGWWARSRFQGLKLQVHAPVVH